MRVAAPPPFELGSGRREASGCITGVLQRILCRNLRERRFADEEEQVVGLRKEERGKSEAGAPASSSPGVVARLMGLESLPAFPYSQPEAISRTRSANSAEPWKGSGILGEQKCGIAGSELRKSQSFREVRSYLRKESEEFLVLSFGDYDECEASELNDKKRDFCSEQCTTKVNRAEKKKSRNKSFVNSAEIVLNDLKSSVPPFVDHISISETEIAERSSSCRKKISFGQRELETDCGSQNSSPVSVLDLPLVADGDCITSPDSSITVCKVSMVSEEEDSRKKVLLEVEDDCRKAGRCGLAAQDLPDIWALICSLAGDDLNNSKWAQANIVKSEEAEEIGFVVWQHMLEILLNEAIFEMFYECRTVY
ncbi:uncharacterized protein LOC110023283 [Phalaenopsis equestris]|uniref:uncharacterized protein LOC110023283 n=1 Tax=Phalaenopsis equestris TaxID=78828 RepID=UPI0009E5749F|nr:uncharacterized protein LOC110023283 [Phalaenopsis equestris]